VNEEQNGFTSLVNKLDLTKYVDFYQFKENDRDLISPVRKLQASEVSKYLSKNSPFAGIWENITHENEEELPTETKELMLEYLHPKLDKLFPLLAEHGLIFLLPNRQPFKTRNIQPIQLGGGRLLPIFRTHTGDNVIEISCYVDIEGELVNVTENEWDSALVFLHKGIVEESGNPREVLVNPQSERLQQFLSGSLK